MSRPPRLIPALLTALATAAGAAHAKSEMPPPTAAPPTPSAAGATGALPSVAANAGGIFVFHIPPAGGVDPAASIEMEAIRPQLKQFLGIDVSDRAELLRLGVDPARPIVFSWAIVDPTKLRALLAAPNPPARDAPFAVRFVLVVPVVDAATPATSLAQHPLDASCASASGDAKRWAALRARLKTPDDKRAADDRSALYVCRGDVTASVVRADAQRRELTWTSAFGDGSLLAAAAAPFTLDAPLASRLQRAGLFAARGGAYTTPADEARAYTAINLVKTLAAAGGIPEADMRAQIWRQGVKELGGHDRLIESPPRLFVDMLATDRDLSWTLTADGKKFFASLGLKPNTDSAGMKQLIVKRLKPTGLFADQQTLVRTVQETGNGAFLLMRHFAWPQLTAFAATQPEVAAAISQADQGGRVELDVAASVLRVRASGAK